MQINKNKSAFTLVELLVVMTVLGILGTIAFIVLKGNIAEARDAARSSDLLEITNVLHLYETENGEYPLPSDNVPILYNGAVSWNQGEFGESVGKEIRKFGQEIPKDPKYGNYFSYSVTPKQKEFQIAGLIESIKQEEEGLGELITGLTPEVSAGSIETSMVLGDYNGFLVKAQTGSLNYFIATPSIIATDISNPDVVDIISNQKLVYDKFFNIPASYSGSLELHGGFNFNVSDPLVYSGSIENLKTEQGLLDFNEKLKYIYATTPTESFDKYVSLLEKDGLTSLKGFLTRKFKLSFRSYFNCKDILDDGLDDGNKMYTIDPDGESGEPPYQVYCDMETDGGGWTRIGDNFITNGDFSGGVGVTGAFEYSNQDNVIVALPEAIEENNYALNQTGNYSTYYKIPFPDNDLLKPGYELRLTLWRSDYGSGEENVASTVNVMGGKYSAWTLGTCTNTGNSCYFGNLNRKLQHAGNFGNGGVLSDIDIQVVNRLNSGQDITSEYLQNGVLFDGYIPSNGYTNVEKELINDWVQAGGFLISTNNQTNYDPLGAYFNMPTIYVASSGARWVVEDIDHPLINGSLGLQVNLANQELLGNYARVTLGGVLEADDTIIARDYYPPYDPTVILRKHGKGHILFMADDGMFMNVSNNLLFEANDNESVFAAAILAYGIEKAAGINPKEGYAFHNRIYYSDGTFSTNGAEQVLDTITIDDNGTPRIWLKEMVRHTIFKDPENFDWYLGLDANNNKDLYFTGLRVELFYK